MIFNLVDSQDKILKSIDLPSAHTGKISSALNGYLVSTMVSLDKNTDVLTIKVPDADDETGKAALGNWIKEVRKTRKWTQSELAEIAKLSLAYVSQTERGYLVPSTKAIAGMITALLFWNTEETAVTTSPKATSNPNEPVIKQDIRNLIDVLLKTDDYRRLELLRGTLEDIERIETEMDKNSFQSSITFLVNLAISDYEKRLNKLDPNN